MLTNRHKNIVTIGYCIFLTAISGFYSIYLESTSDRSSPYPWILLMLIGGFILGWKNLQFKGRQQIQLISLDLLFIANFFVFSFWDNPYGINHLISGVIGVTMIVYIRHRKLSQKG